MVTSSIKAILPCEIHRVWEAVTAVEGYAWRSDLSKTEILDENRFVEYTKWVSDLLYCYKDRAALLLGIRHGKQQYAGALDRPFCRQRG